MSNGDENIQPWQRPFYNSFGIIRLHEEINDFCKYIQPTALEQIVRHNLLDKVKKLLLKRWPLIEVQIFGSFATGLYLPTSDIDIVVFGKWDTLPLWDVEKLLHDSGLSTNVRVIDKASVPIVKFVDKETNYQVDISFNKDNGLKSIPLINEYISKYQNLKSIYLILKQFMLQRDLNEVWTGGIGSYCLMMMCISFFQNYNRNYNTDINLGVLLMEFFELYGRSFNFFNTAIFVSKKGGYRVKFDGTSTQKTSIITIDDPIDKDNDIAKSCYGLFNIRHAFANAYCILASNVTPACMIDNNKGSTSIAMNSSILGSIIRINPEAIKFRQEIQSKFCYLVGMDKEKFQFHLPTVSDLPSDNDQQPCRRSKRNLKRSGSSITENLDKRPRRISQARNWNDLAQWSLENVFKSPTLHNK